MKGDSCRHANFGSATGAFDPATNDLGEPEALGATLGRPVDVVTENMIRNPYVAGSWRPPASPSIQTETRQRLRDALRSCQAMGRHTAALNFAPYERDDMVWDAVECQLRIIWWVDSRL